MDRIIAWTFKSYSYILQMIELKNCINKFVIVITIVNIPLKGEGCCNLIFVIWDHARDHRYKWLCKSEIRYSQ